ncbi:hypothetical protein ACIBSV_44050 [Embleya sp. NPDC050154]|uniref:hypothetical protein n=1 Tax=unclassified Embleya TaxID=2699296 RepID=UPI0037A218D9
MRLSHRIAAATGAVALALGGLTALAPTAQATQADCVTYLAGLGYNTTDTNAACLVGGSGLPLAFQLCSLTLTTVSGVPPAIADEACRRAAL